MFCVDTDIKSVSCSQIVFAPFVVLELVKEVILLGSWDDYMVMTPSAHVGGDDPKMKTTCALCTVKSGIFQSALPCCMSTLMSERQNLASCST